jgi:hypothetical protein
MLDIFYHNKNWDNKLWMNYLYDIYGQGNVMKHLGIDHFIVYTLTVFSLTLISFREILIFIFNVTLACVVHLTFVPSVASGWWYKYRHGFQHCVEFLLSLCHQFSHAHLPPSQQHLCPECAQDQQPPWQTTGPWQCRFHHPQKWRGHRVNTWPQATRFLTFSKYSTPQFCEIPPPKRPQNDSYKGGGGAHFFWRLDLKTRRLQSLKSKPH